jgi:outer membrane protease
LPCHGEGDKKNQYGEVISYTQNWFILTPGISVYIPLYHFFAVNLDFQISPLVFCMDRDEHHLRNFQFKDYMFGGIFLQPAGELTFSLNQKFKITANVSYRFIKGPRGTIVQNDLNTKTSFKYEDLAGTAYSAVAGGLSLKIRL